VNPSRLARKLNEVKSEQIYRKPAYTAEDNGDDDEEDSGSDENSEIKSKPGQSLSLMNRAKSRTIHIAAKGRSKRPSEKKPKPVVISLLTDDEDEDLEVPAAATPGQRNHPSSQKYVPVDNSKFTAYAQTHRFLNNGKNRKRIAVRW